MSQEFPTISLAITQNIVWIDDVSDSRHQIYTSGGKQRTLKISENFNSVNGFVLDLFFAKLQDCC